MLTKMEVFFVALISCHVFATMPMASGAKKRFKNKIFEGADALGLGVNNTGPHQYLKNGSHRTLVPINAACYRAFFVGGQPPTGLRPPNNANIRYICQQLEDFNDETYYATMFDLHIGIAVYSAYIVRHDQGRAIYWNFSQDIEMASGSRLASLSLSANIPPNRQGSDPMYHNNGQHIHKGHLVPAKTYSYDCIAMVSTFRFTNAVPQFAAFNTGLWNTYEDRVRKLGEVCRLNGGDLYLMTGTSEAKFIAAAWQKQPTSYFPVNAAHNPNIAIPNSMWTAGCCINQNRQAVGGFGMIGNNDQNNPTMEHKTVAELQAILDIGIGPGAAVQLFPGNARCSADTNQFRHPHLAMHGGGWTKSIQL